MCTKTRIGRTFTGTGRRLHLCLRGRKKNFLPCRTCFLRIVRQFGRGQFLRHSARTPWPQAPSRGKGSMSFMCALFLPTFLVFRKAGQRRPGAAQGKKDQPACSSMRRKIPRGLRKIVSLPGTRSFLALAGSTLSQAPSAHQSREPCVSFPGTAAEKGCISWPPGQSALQRSLIASGPG